MKAPDEQQPPARYATASDLATLLRCHRATIHRLVRIGRLPKAHRFGGLVRWRLDEVEAALAADGSAS
jgi:excisionase family DNA binding protein